MSGPALTPYHHLLTEEERAKLVEERAFPMTAQNKIVVGMMLYEAYIDTETTTDKSQYTANQLAMLEYKSNVGSYEMRDRMFELIEAVEIGWYCLPSGHDIYAFDFEYVPQFVAKLVDWSASPEPSLHPQWVDCIRATKGNTIPSPDELTPAPAVDDKQAWELLIYPPEEGEPTHWYYELKDQFLKAFEFSHNLPAHGYMVTARILRGEEECAEAEKRSEGANDAWELEHWATERGLAA